MFGVDWTISVSDLMAFGAIIGAWWKLQGNQIKALTTQFQQYDFILLGTKDRPGLIHDVSKLTVDMYDDKGKVSRLERNIARFGLSKPQADHGEQ